MQTNMFSLEGKIALVTGANTGLGQAMAIALARAGAAVSLVGRSSPDETHAAIDGFGGQSAVVMADLGSTAVVDSVVAETEESLGPVDVLINNAGIIRRDEALEFGEQDWDDVMSINLKVPFFLAQKVARSMVAREAKGKIINIASLLSLQGGIRVASYTASKSGLAGLTRLLSNEWAGRGINVNAIVPGYFSTNNTAALRSDADRNRQILERIPAGRWGDPAELGGAAIYLASPASDYVHGILLPVDGGWMAR